MHYVELRLGDVVCFPLTLSRHLRFLLRSYDYEELLLTFIASFPFILPRHVLFLLRSCDYDELVLRFVVFLLLNINARVIFDTLVSLYWMRMKVRDEH